MKHFAFCLFLALAAVPGASADTTSPNALLTQKAMQAELFGIRMSGIELSTGARWSECVEPGGRTLYEIAGTKREGVLAITDTPEACFTYPVSGTSCFRVQRAPKGYMFRSSEYGGAYHASKIERGVKTCIASDLIG